VEGVVKDVFSLAALFSLTNVLMKVCLKSYYANDASAFSASLSRADILGISGKVTLRKGGLCRLPGARAFNSVDNLYDRPQVRGEVSDGSAP